MTGQIDRTAILTMIRNGQISPEDGLALLRAAGAPAPEPTAAPGEVPAPTAAEVPTPAPVPACAPVSEIAVIGMAGRFPGAENLDEFWRNLCAGVDSVTEVPPSRWNMAAHYDPEIKTPRKTYCKWSGMLSRIDQFDPLFFGITPREAELMDPQQRIFLEEAWKALEDAGYAPEAMSGRKCGVFAGIGQADYAASIRATGSPLDSHFLLGSAGSVLAARIAYMLNLTGPNMAIDTACSSSLVAIHQACQSIACGESEMALAGGVCAFATPEMHITTSKGGMLSKTGKCRAFDNEADGFVPSEGVGLVVLKALPQALADGDQIYGVIRGWGMNQDGRTNGLTAPSAGSQTRLLTETYARFGIHPDQISYVEAHGTGTKLGDPIEVSALTNAFRQHTDRRNYCAIGSVKSNIGHTLSAAGVASLIKVLLCLRHRKLVPTLHVRQLNEHIDFDNSPFYVGAELKDWTAPRLAAVSAFGLSGTNCHLVVAEAPSLPAETEAGAGPWLVPLSAKTEQALMQRIRDLALWLEGAHGASLGQISYTLMTGRGHFAYRCAIIATDLPDLKATLARILLGERCPNALMGRSQEPGAAAADQHSLYAIARRYAGGGEVKWEEVAEADRRYRRISLPTYPFAKMVCWHPSGVPELPDARLHPLIATNRSTFDGQRYSVTLTGEEFFLTDHLVVGEKTVPGAALMEMARAAAELAAGRTPVRLKSVFFLRPAIVAAGPLSLHAVLTPTADGGADFAIHSTGAAGEEILHARGSVTYSPADGGDLVDIEAIRRRCAVQIARADCYSRFRAMGVTYGPSFQGIAELLSGEEEALAKVELQGGTPSGFVLHPALLDGALQTVLGVGRLWSAETTPTYLPFALDELEVRAPLPETCYVHAVLVGGSHSAQAHRFDLRIAGADGRLVARLQGYAIRPLGQAAEPQEQVLYFGTRWVPASLTVRELPKEPLLVVASAAQRAALALDGALSGRPVTFAYPGDRFARLEDGAYQFRPYEISDCERLTEALGLNEAMPRQILLLADVLPAAADCPNVHLLLGLTQALMKAKARRVEILYAFTNPGKAVQPYHWAVSGFARSLVVENPNFTCRVVEMGGATQVPVLLSELADLAAGAAEIEIRYDGTVRMTRVCHEVQPGALPAGSLPLRRGGVCLITGGAGGLGLLFARDLFEQCGARLVLVGRSQLNSQQQRQIDDLKADGAEVTYLQADVSDPQQVLRLVARVKELYGGLHGVIHSAGQLRDAYILHKTSAEMAAVLAPKVGGCLALDAATADEPLDFFVLFSAIASVVGNVGQCDYAFANAYLDRFAELRSQLVQDGRRSGKSVAINWPLWRDGGMQITEETARWLRKRLGMGALSSAAGLAALPLALRSGSSQMVVIAGEAQPVRAAFLGGAGQQPGSPSAAEPAPAAEGSLLEQTRHHLQAIFAKVTGMPLDALDLHESLTDLGIDSIIIVGINNELETCYGGLPKTLLFEYKTIAELAAYLVENHRDVVAGYQARLAPTPAPAPAATLPAAAVAPTVAVVAPTATEVPDRGARRDEIAIVGLSGRYPMAADLDQFWELLKAGRDCITEIPPERWEHSRYFDPDKERPGKSYAKWGGFIDDVDKFDPLFFNIAPREAELMDPQERLFLESAWQAVEDAGYTRTDLARQTVGVFVGVMYSHYQLVALEEQLKGGTASSTSCSAAIANRVSYCLNLNGPSVALDTMCSSSLTAIHLACSSIKSGDCDMAIAGGVNLTIHPGKYLLLSQGKFASSDGRCRSFGEGGDGYVPGEGVGAVVLKPLARALADGDHIYGVIKGSAVNHGGKTNGFTVPTPHAQADVITAALERTGVDPRTISFLEAHGTGTSLGDPIEIRGLSKAYSAFTSDRQFCAIGSVKSNIGHLESASGIAAVTKVLLQMQHKQLAPSIHASTLNPNIDFAASPFYVQRELAAWQKPAGGPPRRAGVSAFGAGGANAHLIIEEYEPAQAGPVSGEGEQHLFVLSARTEERLQEYARRLAAHLERRYLPAGGAPLAAIAYTLQLGREPLEVRLAITASTLAELLQSLRGYADGRPGSQCITGTVRQRPAQTAARADLSARRDLMGLAQAWVQGDEVNWRLLYPAAPGRISLPTYPFARKRYWLGDQKLLSAAAPAPAEASVAPPVTPGAPDWEGLAAGYQGDEVTLEVIDGQIALVTMQDRQHKNMFSDRIITGLVARSAEIRRNPAIKAVVVTGYDHVFSMGGTQQQLLDIADSKSSFTDAPFLYRGLLELEIPVVSAIQGHASGGGLLFGLYADIIIMSEESVYSAVFMKYGFTPGMGATYLLREKLGTNLATEMMFTARSFRGEELQQRGASVIFRPSAEVLPEALAVAKLLAEKPIHALRVLKKELAGRILEQLPAHIERESQMHAQTFSHPEVKERIGHYFLSGRTAAEPAAERPQQPPQSQQLPQPQRLQLKRRLPQAEPEQQPAPSRQPEVVPTVNVREQVTAIVCQILRLTPSDLRPAATFQELGADSISGLEIVRDINKAFQLNLEAVVLYDYPTIDRMAEHVLMQAPRLALQAALSAAAPALALSAPAPAVAEPVSRPAAQPPAATEPARVDGARVLAEVCTAVGRILRLDQSELNIEATFQALGTDSISGVEIVRDLNRIFHLNLDAVVLYDYPSPAQLAEHIRSQLVPTGPWRTEPEPPKPAVKSSRLIGLDVKEYEKYRERDAANKTVALAPAGRAVVQLAHGADAAGDAPQAPAAAPPKQRLQLTRRSPREPEEEETDRVTVPSARREGVAIIGMSGRFPGAPDLQQFWANLKNGVESIAEVPPERWDAEACYAPAPRTPGKSYSKVGGFLAETDRFDPLFFNISPLEAETMDPQQRIFLEEAWSALEDAGYSAESLSGAQCGVFVGAARGDFARAMAPSGADYSGDAFTGLAPSILAARISYWLNLKGPSLALDTACSSSLVAIHLACQSILTGESDMALAGGVRLMLTPEMHMQTSQLGILSPTGHCRAFDQEADGTILSEGVGVVVLKPLSKALADGDHIYGVIRGSGVNQDGKTNGITAPSAQSQTELELAVYRRAGIDPAEISYIETHGTGTKLGDPIEIKALKNAFAAYTSKRRFCAIGSVKTNIGHATMAAGVASVIKVLLAMKHRLLPPTLHFNQPNEHINFPDTPFYVNTELADWTPPEGGRRLAAVSSFGFSGTNCHLVIEEAPTD